MTKNDQKSNNKLKYLVLLMLLVVSGAVSFFLFAGNNNAQRINFTLNLEVISRLEGQEGSNVELNESLSFDYRLTLTLEELFNEFEFDFSEFQEINFRTGFSWRLSYNDKLLNDSLDFVIINNLTTDKNLTIELVRSANRHWVNIDLQGGRFQDPNDLILAMDQIHYVGVSNGFLQLQIEYQTNLVDLFTKMFSNNMLTGIGIYSEILFMYMDNPLHLTEWFPFMPDHELELQVEWFSDLAYGTNIRGTAFTDGTLPEDLTIRIYADMDEAEMLAAVNAAVNIFGTETNRPNIRSNNFEINVTRYEDEDGNVTVLVVIDRVNIRNLTINGTAHGMLLAAGFNLSDNDLFLDMTEEQIEELIAARMIQTNRTNFVFGNFTVNIINFHEHDLHISINREMFDSYSLLGDAFATDLLTSAVLRLETMFFRDMTRIEIENELQRIMDEFNVENARIHSTHFSIENVSGMHLRVLTLDITRVEMMNIDTQGSAFFDEDYNVRVLETLDLSGLFLDMTEQQLINIIQDRIDAMNEDVTRNQLFDFNRNNFSTPLIENYHSTDIVITINREIIDPIIEGNAISRFDIELLKDIMDTVFRDLLEKLVLEIFHRAIDDYGIVNFTRNAFTTRYLKSDYQTITLFIERRDVTPILHGNATYAENELLNNNNLSIANGIFMDMTQDEIRTLLYGRINSINTNRFHEDHFNISLITGEGTQNINITILRVNAVITGAGNAFTTEDLLNVVELGLNTSIFRDMTHQMIVDTLNAAMNSSLNDRIHSSHFTVGTITAPHGENITINIARNLITPLVNGTAYIDDVLRGRLTLEPIFRDMTETMIRTLVQDGINGIPGTRFNHLHFDEVIVEGTHLANISIRINRADVTPGFTGSAYVAGVLLDVIDLNTGIFRDMEESEITRILEEKLDSFGNPRFRSANFEIYEVRNVHQTNIIIDIRRIDITPEDFVWVGDAEDAFPGEFWTEITIFKDMDNEMIQSLIGQAIDDLGGDYSNRVRAWYRITVEYIHSEGIIITIFAITSSVNIIGSAVDQGLIPRYLLDEYEFYLLDGEEYILIVLAEHLEQIAANLVIGNFDVYIDGAHDELITITINRRLVSNIVIDGNATEVRNELSNLNVTHVYWDMLYSDVLARLNQALVTLNQANLTLNRFNISTSGLHTEEVTIYIQRIAMTTVTIAGTAINHLRFNQADLGLETIFRDDTMPEILEIVRSAIDDNLDDVRFTRNFFEISGGQHTLTAVTINVDRINVTPSLDGDAVTTVGLLNAENLRTNEGFFMDMSAAEIATEIEDRFAAIAGSRFARTHFSVSEDTVNGAHTMNITVEISRVLANVNTHGDAFTTEDLLTIENLNLDTQIFRDMTLALIQTHLTTAMNNLNAGNARLHSNHFDVGPITAVHGETVSITITRRLAVIITDGTAFTVDGLLTSDNLVLATSIFRDMTQGMIEEYLENRIDEINELGNARIHNDHFNIVSITTAHAANITVVINRILAVVTGEGDAFDTPGLLSSGNLSLNTAIFRDMTELMIVNHLTAVMDANNNSRIHSSHFVIYSITTAHSESIVITIIRQDVTPSTSGTAFIEYNILNSIDLSGIYLDMEVYQIVLIIQARIDDMGDSENRIERGNFSIPVVTNEHTINLNVEINRVGINVVVEGTAVVLYNRFSQEDLNLASLEVNFFRDMLADEILYVINYAIDHNLLQNHFTSDAFAVEVRGRDIDTITIDVNRLTLDATIGGTAITDERFTEINITSALSNVYRDMIAIEFEGAVNSAINTLAGLNPRFVAANFNVQYINHNFDTNNVTININRIEMAINLSGSAFPRLSGNEHAAEAYEQGIANLMLGMDYLFMDMTHYEVSDVIFDALDFVGDLLDRPTFNRNTFDVFHQGINEETRTITFAIERVSIIPDLGGDAMLPGGPFLPGWLRS